MSFKIPRTVQCAKCPWKVSTNPFEIPEGYDVEKHENLSCTINSGLDSLRSNNAMACHHSDGNDQMYCIGWLVNQLGPGNNIGLRIKFMSCENARDIKVKGKQHEKFEDTLPQF
jgi:hypothetical protein